ncbi:MAG: hypothetical protein UX25_C0020G0008 [Candidatus Woesebacteria bacterium GW2011_GWC2_45_9]|uniref:Glycosyltransferase RgtA/B/C/D-like domain-containing protein n=1 Tax=Candidatus Woesebacteria bacterium GW2011_GWC2_45_9 TaxID=1618589 RepID=A0A0G1N9C1_9BACT|nr:MAG: hypothetical protein UX25_C0020G0008 [Candidatus Woesebacteria bacterium GW2011_GWC2_45_9]
MILIGLLLVILFGYSLSRPFGNKFSVIEDLGLSYILGIGIFAWLMYSLSGLGLKITLGNYLTILILLITLFYLVFGRRFNIFAKLRKLLGGKVFEKREKILIGFIVILLVIAFVHAIYWPVNVWDSLVLYDFRAKVISEKGFFLQISRDFEYFAHYPPLTSLAHVWIYLLNGSNPRILYFLFFLAFIGVFYAKLRERLRRFSSLFLLLLLVSIPALLHHSTFSYTNLPYTIYLSLGFIYLHDFLVDKNTNSLKISAILLGLSTFTRQHEPFWLVGILLTL